MQNHTATVNIALRDDTFLGICEAIGEDFGFNANWLRVALGAMVIWSPVAAIATYLALGVPVLASRLLFPKPKSAANAEEAQTASGDETLALAA